MGLIKTLTDQIEAIPGQIKSWYIPFTLNTEGPSFYSFKKQSNDQKMFIGICPNSFQEMIKGDVGYKMISNFDDENAISDRKTEIDINTIFNQIPSIRIREIQQDSKMQDIASALKIISEGFNVGVEVAKNIFTDFTATTTAITNSAEELFEALLNPGKDIKFNYNGGKKDNDLMVLNYPYALYYNLIGSTTTNIYELPCNYTDLQRNINANGWEYNEDDGMGFGSIGTSGIIGKALNFLGSNFSIKLQPRWKSSDTSPQTVTISVNLFNDTLEHAVANYIMVTNLTANAMSLQYGLYKHAPAYYDVKIAGFTRMFMCKGTINISHAGQTRTPNIEFYNELKKYKNKYYDYEEKNFITNQWIKIPDVYKLQLTFDSLLPQNLNNYVYQFSQNDLKMYNEYKTYDYQKGYMEMAKNKISSFVDKIKTEIEEQKKKEQNNT